MNAQAQPVAQATVTPLESRSLVVDMARQYGIEPRAFTNTLRATVVPKETSNEELAAFLMIASKYSLNPFLREIFAFPKKGGGIQTIVSIDGWSNLINSHPQFNGAEFAEHTDKSGKVIGITCKIWRKDRERPIAITEYLAECKRNTDVWNQWPMRMLRHRSFIQCGRYAFGFAGLLEPDEVDYQHMRDVTPREGRDAGPPLPDETVKEEESASPQRTSNPGAEAGTGAPAVGGSSPDTAANERGAPTDAAERERIAGIEALAASAARQEQEGSDLFENALALATQRGWDAHKAGQSRKAMPGEYRDQKRAEEADAWLLGWDRYGESVKG
jgi:phage recombination protein Bet